MLLLVLPRRQQTTRQASKQDPYRWLRFLQTLQDVDHFGFLFDVLHFLNDIQARRSGTSHVDGDWLHQRTARKVLNLLGHGGREQQCLTLALQPRISASVTCQPSARIQGYLFPSDRQMCTGICLTTRDGYMPNHYFCILYSSWLPPKNNSPGKF